MRKILYLLPFILLTGCMYFEQEVRIVSSPAISHSIIGKEKEVKFEIFDKRDNSRTLGRRSGYGGEIFLKEDIIGVLANQFTYGLSRNGFNISDQSQISIEVTLLHLNYTTSSGILTVGSEVRSAIEVNIKNSYGISVFKKIYRSNFSKTHFLFYPFADENEENINNTFRSLLEDILNDKHLFYALKNAV